MPEKPVLLFAYGNLSRGDDALAPLLLEQLQSSGLNTACGRPLKFLCDYQIQVEHSADMHDCERVLLMDASQVLSKPWQFYEPELQQETLYTTHGMSPSTLMYTYRQVYHSEPPLTCMLAIAGFNFELGQGLSQRARFNLQQAKEFLHRILNQRDFGLWDRALQS